MDRIKNFKYLSWAMLLFGFVFATSLTACNNTGQKEGDIEQTDGSEAQDEHPTDSSEEHPTDSSEHPDN
ncbi:hypothetical protein [Parapedobacter tibetensis]|uniref:hypothetical protein n=1 Tax=Parapedobacter tibetensis TaxID=2972951 RepID=UPI00214D68E2|nr:hypothetical protein [Parapedobacter tibetensis]